MENKNTFQGHDPRCFRPDMGTAPEVEASADVQLLNSCNKSLTSIQVKQEPKFILATSLTTLASMSFFI